MAILDNIPDHLMAQIKEDYMQIGRGMRISPQTVADQIPSVEPMKKFLLFSQRMQLTSTIDEMVEL